jgi:hypothetical protein
LQVLVNERFLKRESRIGKVLLGLTFLLLGLGMFLSLQSERWSRALEPWVGEELLPWVPIAFTYVIVILGVTLMQVANPRIRRFAPQHRQDYRLRQLLKGLDDRYVLYAFLGQRLPDYLLIGPGGVYVLTTRPQDGEITCNGDRWSRRLNPLQGVFVRLYGNPLGNPSYDTARAVQRVRDFLRERLPTAGEDMPVSGLIVFTAERVRLRVERCSFAATTGREVRKVIGKARAGLNQAALAELRAVFDPARAS